jgi:FdhE protein
MDATRQNWLADHPFLAPLARFQELVGGAAAALPAPSLDLAAPFDAHAEAYAAGVPLVRGPSHGPFLGAAGASLLGELLASLGGVALPPAIADGVAEVRAALATPEACAGAMAWLVADDQSAPAPVQAGLLRYLGWTALGRVLGPLAAPFAAWRDDARWRRPTCPTCGALPVMAQLVDRGAVRERRLVCGRCPTQWSFKRVACPYCGNEAADRLALLELEGPAGLRLDVCESCKGYLKTYTGHGEEALFLADWPTLVLDAMAVERGYQRRGASLFEL